MSRKKITGSLFSIPIEKMNKEQLIKCFSLLVSKLDELDDEDYFGTEGWKHYFGLND